MSAIYLVFLFSCAGVKAVADAADLFVEGRMHHAAAAFQVSLLLLAG